MSTETVFAEIAQELDLTRHTWTWRRWDMHNRAGIPSFIPAWWN